MTEFFRQHKDKITIYDEYDDKHELEEFIDLYTNRDKLTAQNSQKLAISAQGGIRGVSDDTTESYITTPIDHIEYRDFMLNDAPFLAGHSTTIFSTKFY